jgi:single-stranded-DNA-specific exonuclease
MDAVHVPYLQEDFIRFAEDTLTPDDLRPILSIDATASLADITPALLTQLAHFTPHGVGNPVPLFCAHGVQIASPPRPMGQDGQHVRFRAMQGTVMLESVAFQQAKQVFALASTGLVDLAFTPTINTWQGRNTIELHIRALRSHVPLASRPPY